MFPFFSAALSITCTHSQRGRCEASDMYELWCDSSTLLKHTMTALMIWSLPAVPPCGFNKCAGPLLCFSFLTFMSGCKRKKKKRKSYNPSLNPLTHNSCFQWPVLWSINKRLSTEIEWCPGQRNQLCPSVHLWALSSTSPPLSHLFSGECGPASEC